MLPLCLRVSMGEAEFSSIFESAIKRIPIFADWRPANDLDHEAVHAQDVLFR